MSARDLDAAGVTDPALRASYEACRRLFVAHGRTYYLATLLLPPAKRPAVHALYGFARYADEIVDDLASTLTPPERSAALALLAERALCGDSIGDAVLPAFEHTVSTWDIDRGHVEAFLCSMAMDITVAEYATWDDLLTYVDGSASVIGLQMLPVLAPLPGFHDLAVPYARDLGTAFQLTNFIRDVGEDLDRGRLYLPLEDLAAHDLSRADLERHRADRLNADGRVRGLLRFEVSRCRALFSAAEPGIRLLDPTSRPCIEAAFTLYRGILDEVERAGFDVLRQRVSVGIPRRLAVAGPAWVRAVRARRPQALRPQNAHQASVWRTSEKPNSRSSTGA